MQRDHREALLRNLATSVILFEKVKTTKARAKQVQPIVEKLITKAKTKETVEAIRQIGKVVLDEKASRKLLEVLKNRYKDRPGGYTRLVKLGHRAGDAAEMVQIQLV
jgi:large subunit ribosomal protein L17